VAQTLMGVAPSASAVSRLNQTLTDQFEGWRERRLLTHYRILYLDGIHFTVRHGTQTDSTIILTALGVDLEGNKDVLALRACAEENKDGWSCLVQDLRTRGVTEIDLIVTDGHDGLLAAVASLFPVTLRQRCLVHKQRNVMNAIAHREHKEVAAELAGIWKAPTVEEARTQLAAFKGKYRLRYPEAIRSLCEDEDHLLTFYAFPQVMHRYIRSTNAIESLFSNVRGRTDQIDVLYFGDELSDYRLGCDARYPPAKNSGRLKAKHCLLVVYKQPTEKDGSGGGDVFCYSCVTGTQQVPRENKDTALSADD
jgi:putative transposase